MALPAERKVFVDSWADVPVEVARRARPGDVVVTMGAPPISLMGDELLTALAARTADPQAPVGTVAGGLAGGSTSIGGTVPGAVGVDGAAPVAE